MQFVSPGLPPGPRKLLMSSGHGYVRDCQVHDTWLLWDLQTSPVMSRLQLMLMISNLSLWQLR